MQPTIVVVSNDVDVATTRDALGRRAVAHFGPSLPESTLLASSMTPTGKRDRCVSAQTDTKALDLPERG